MSAEEDERQSSDRAAAMASCRKKKSEEATFLEDVKDHIDEFIHASMDEHKSCFQKTIRKMFGMSKVVAERAAVAKQVESALPLQTSYLTSRVSSKTNIYLINILEYAKYVIRY